MQALNITIFGISSFIRCGIIVNVFVFMQFELICILIQHSRKFVVVR